MDVMKQDTVLETAKVAIRSEIDALESLLQAIDENFVKVVDLISCSLGRVMITGVGKSGHVGNKIAATLASLGTPSYFVHATEGVHGDLGMIASEDIVIAISNSGQTREKFHPGGSLGKKYRRKRNDKNGNRKSRGW